jgi:hypothetical protein
LRAGHPAVPAAEIEVQGFHDRFLTSCGTLGRLYRPPEARTRSFMFLARQQVARGEALVDAEVLGALDDAAVAQVFDHARVASQADRGVAGHAADRLLAFFVGAAQQQVGDAFLGQDVGDVVAVDHHRRDRHLRLFGQLPGVRALDEGRLHVLAEGLDHLHHQLLAARDGIGPRAPVRRPSARPGWRGAGRARRRPCWGRRRSRRCGPAWRWTSCPASRSAGSSR